MGNGISAINKIQINSHRAFAVDFNNDAIKLLQLEKNGSHSRVTGWGKTALPKDVVDYYEIKDLARFQETFLAAVKDAAGKIKGRNVVLALPENKVFTRIISLPFMKPEEAGEAVKYETEANIPISIDEVYFDWQIVEQATDTMKVLVMASPRRVIDNYIEAFDGIGYTVVAIEAESIATARSVIAEGDNSSVLLVDFGADNTSYAIYHQGFPVFTSSGTISGKLVTDAIAKKLGITNEQAEGYKMKIGLGEPEKPNEDVHDVLNPLVASMVSDLERTMSFYDDKLNQNKSDHIERIVLSGGGSNLKGLASHLAIHLKSEIAQSNPWVNVNLGKVTPPIPLATAQGYSTAIGLAIRAQNHEDYY